jgi:hypothetical protein
MKLEIMSQFSPIMPIVPNPMQSPSALASVCGRKADAKSPSQSELVPPIFFIDVCRRFEDTPNKTKHGISHVLKSSSAYTNVSNEILHGVQFS